MAELYDGSIGIRPHHIGSYIVIYGSVQPKPSFRSFAGFEIASLGFDDLNVVTI